MLYRWWKENMNFFLFLCSLWRCPWKIYDHWSILHAFSPVTVFYTFFLILHSYHLLLKLTFSGIIGLFSSIKAIRIDFRFTFPYPLILSSFQYIFYALNQIFSIITSLPHPLLLVLSAFHLYLSSIWKVALPLSSVSVLLSFFTFLFNLCRNILSSVLNVGKAITPLFQSLLWGEDSPMRRGWRRNH